jgi:hypothetical protein
MQMQGGAQGLGQGQGQGQGSHSAAPSAMMQMAAASLAGKAPGEMVTEQSISLKLERFK